MIGLINADTLTIPLATVLWYNNVMRDKQGRFTKGHRASPSTEFKEGQHWRNPKAHWEHDWLYARYIKDEMSAAEIAKAQGCTENNIYYWLDRHNIPRRTMTEIRAVKHWGLSGEANAMYGVRGKDNPNWKGGATPERQAFYSGEEWRHVADKARKRDGGLCQRCNDKGDHLHHIISFANKEHRADIDNLILLCRSCHHWVHSRENTSGDFIG
jgi:hypothetical protein